MTLPGEGDSVPIGLTACFRLRKHIQDFPGCSVRETGIAAKIARHRLTRLVKELGASGDVYIAQGRKSNYLLPNVPGIKSAWRQVVALRDPPTNHLYARLWVEAPATRKVLVNYAAAAWGLGRGFVEDRLAVLLEAGLVQRHASPGRHARYAPCPMRAAAFRVLLPNPRPISIREGTRIQPIEEGS